MAFSASPHCAPPLHRFGLRRFPPPQPPLAFMRCPFFSSSSFRPVYFSPAPTLRIIVSANSKKPYSGRSADSTSASAIDFLTLCHSLKTTKRKGWINHGIKGPESIADHMYRMALMALIAGDLPGVNRERCIKIAIVHDIAEAIVGDITPSCGVPKEEKSRREQAALTEMCKILGGGMRAEEIQELWLEYENNASLEANLVKDFDKVELILQALEYELEHGKVLNEFFLSTEGRVDYLKQDVISESILFFSDVYSSTLPCGFSGKFQTEIGKSWAREINSRRNSILAEKRKGPK